MYNTRFLASIIYNSSNKVVPMAFDFGSEKLGIQNPFKTEGYIKTIAGILLALSSISILLSISETLKVEPVMAYTYAILGFILLAIGLRNAGSGIFQLFRYFVGRSVPTSLAPNQSVSEQDAANMEKNAVLYNDKQLHSMLMGRKNTTFREPVGWVSRLVHTLLPKLTFMPYPLRFLALELTGVVINLFAVLVVFSIVYFIVSTGLAGEIAQVLVMPLLSILLLFYLVLSWRSAAKSINRKNQSQIKKAGGLSVAVLMALAIIIPVFAGFYLDKIFPYTPQEVTDFTNSIGLFSAWTNLLILLIAILIVLASVLPLLFARFKTANPLTDVSEFRENMQESVHPNEIFINIENIVLANRRYKEIPNRIYRNFDPKLTEQADGKGSFNGELLVETQPALSNDPIGDKKLLKTILTFLSQIAMLVGFFLFYWLGISIAETIIFVQDLPVGTYSDASLAILVSDINNILFYFFAWLSISTSSSLMVKASHLFWGELQFDSLLMFMKTEGTYTESRISTGMAIHDSTRSENVVVRSSITPWIISSRITTSIFATSGVNNLEAPRYILTMRKNEDELKGIVAEIKSFLRKREAIASITNESDLQSASNIHQVNQQTRSSITTSQDKLSIKDEDISGFLRNNQTKDDDKKE